MYEVGPRIRRGNGDANRTSRVISPRLISKDSTVYVNLYVNLSLFLTAEIILSDRLRGFPPFPHFCQSSKYNERESRESARKTPSTRKKRDTQGRESPLFRPGAILVRARVSWGACPFDLSEGSFDFNEFSGFIRP